jgi:succinyl-diaminopimelate desuccinylase
MPTDASELIREQDIVTLTQELVRIPSQYIEEEVVEHDECAAFLADRLRTLGFEVEVATGVEGYPVVVASTPDVGEGLTLGIIGHYSTVAIGDRAEWTYDPLGGELVDGKIYGRGSTDQKGGIAAVIMAAKALMDLGVPLKGRVRLLLVPGEGCTELALEPIVKSNPDVLRCDAYLDSDGGPGRISLVHGGWIWIELLTKGKGGHSGSLTSQGEVPVNPVLSMMRVLTHLADGRWMTTERHRLFGPEENGRYNRDPIVDVNVFRAGSKVNMIPNEARAQIDVRMLPAQTIPGVMAELDRALDALRAEDPDLDVSYRILNRSKNPHEVTPDHDVIRAIQATCKAHGEPEPELVGSFGGGRAALADFGPVMHFGAGGGSGAHSPDEYALVDKLVTGAKLHATLYTKLFT